MKSGEGLRKAAGIYSIMLGAAVLAMWIMILSRETIEEGDTEMAFHLGSEFLMAVLCTGSGICLFRGACLSKGVRLSRADKAANLGGRAVLANLAGHSMVVYSVINAAGYYAERGEGSMVLVFLVLLVPSGSILAIHLTQSPSKHPASTPD